MLSSSFEDGGGFLFLSVECKVQSLELVDSRASKYYKQTLNTLHSQLHLKREEIRDGKSRDINANKV